MNLNQLQYFIAVGRSSSFSKAAKEMYVSQPAISDAIKSLEQELGVNLFHRVKQRIYLTDEGKVYLEKVSSIIDELAAANKDMILLGKNKKVVRLGIPPMIGSFVYPQIFTEFEQYRPDIQLEVREGGSLELLQELDTEQIDLAIVAKSDRYESSCPQLFFKKFSSTELMYCVSENHHLAKKKHITITMLEHERLILFKEGYIQNKIMTDAFKDKQIKPEIILLTNQILTIITFIKKNIGSSFMYADVAKMIDGIVAINFQDTIEVDLALVWKAKRTQYKDVEAFIDFFSHNNT